MMDTTNHCPRCEQYAKERDEARAELAELEGARWLTSAGMVAALDDLADTADSHADGKWQHWTYLQAPLAVMLAACDLGYAENRSEEVDEDGGWYAITEAGAKWREEQHAIADAISKWAGGAK